MKKSTLLFSLIFLAGAFLKLDAQLRNPYLGEFDNRVQLAYERMTLPKFQPVFTKDFILADVDIDLSDPRRFYNFSGDLSGRYIEVISLFPNLEKNEINLHEVVKELQNFQKADGRFGDEALIFNEEEISGEHMALLWGNGRLLVGLTTFYQEYPNEKVLESARKLGDFFISTFESCATPEVRKKLDGFGAKGIICFTQYIEGLVKLSEITKDKKYAEIAAKTYVVLPDRGKQHSHGYLSTLRGVVDLYDYNGEIKHLDYVEEAFNRLIASDDYTKFGSVHEYFGGKGDRDEGCSTADFTRLAFQLFQQTGNKKYLEIGERALFNALYYNQFHTGDFGHHNLTRDGSKPNGMQAAWWCCTMHGLRALKAIKNDFMVRSVEGINYLDLYLETSYSNEEIQYVLALKGEKEGVYQYDIKLEEVKSGKMAFRIPEWTETFEVSNNGEKLTFKNKDGYAIIDKLKSGDQLSINFTMEMVLEKGKKEIEWDGESLVDGGILKYGPYLMMADGETDPAFTAEPARGNNVKYSSISPEPYLSGEEPLGFEFYYLKAIYKHSGFPSKLDTYLKPVAEATYYKHPAVQMIMNFSEGKKYDDSQDLLNPEEQN